MSSHILLSQATRRPYQEAPTLPEDCIYDSAKGFWTVNGEPLVRSEQFAERPVTKKCDQETGEDQKGE